MNAHTLRYVDIFSLLAFRCKNLPINSLFSSMVVVAPFSDAGGHAKRKNRERRAEIYTISQAFETLKESPACIGKLVGRQGISDVCRNLGVLPGGKIPQNQLSHKLPYHNATGAQIVRYTYKCFSSTCFGAAKIFPPIPHSSRPRLVAPFSDASAMRSVTGNPGRNSQCFRKL
jgi:hypothetical protein